MPLQKFATSAAHKLAALVAESGVVPPDSPVVGHAVLEIAGIQITVFVARYDGPLRIHPETLAAIDALRPDPPQLTPLMQRILEVLSRERPMKAEVIAMKLGKNCGGSFRSLLADMVRYGVVKHIHRVGYLLI